ncbi:MAG TPA: lipoprotein insertase outer membrane protein LolB [Pseudomonas sp.]|uniref:lipoprotein insertase outer membrane protein LolB n=1 Tax=Pseudomonas sp. TaxID=306 RepID=UPI002BECFF5F|nr:lipoprotein insertase outer membrane protein LolB [Pseudomonas sp.]HRL93768.1 lipoprotein insertase outer membrane protein LolB [Pseudomonas sp.]
MHLRHLIAIGCLALLSGCAGLTSHETLSGQGNPAQWQAHKAQASQLNGWQISGKVGIRSPRESGSATLFWLQRQDYFDIRLAGPMGRGAARLTGRPGAVSLDAANQGQFQAESAEALLQQQLGWSLPVAHLFWWIRGLPAEDSKSRLTLDSESRLAKLEQDDWQVEYLSYVQQNGYWLPERMKLHGANLDITLVIKDWQPRQLGQ